MKAVNSVYPLKPSRSVAVYMLCGIAACLFVSALFMAGLAYTKRQPALYFGAVVELLAVGAMIGLTRSMSSTVVELDAKELRVRSFIFGRAIPRLDLMAERARVVDLSVETDLKPRWRTWGLGLPTYQAGWFRLANGDKALLFVSDNTQVVELPTRIGYTILLSVTNPAEFLRALKPQR
jgi:hypothetical protein